MLSTQFSINKLARLAGFFYLIVVITGILSLGYIPSQIFRADIVETVSSLRASQTLFKLGISAGIICYLAFILLSLTLYQLLSPVGKNAASLMVILVLVSIPISFVNLIYQLDILSLLNGEHYSIFFTQAQIHGQFSLLLDHYKNGIFLLKIFWGLWLFPFGYLVYKSGFIPKLFGILLMVGCFSYVIGFFCKLFWVDFSLTVFARLFSTPQQIAEIGICFWLLIMGARQRKNNG
jgi:hypothetical protein